MARNRGPAYSPPPPDPEDLKDAEGTVVCCLGECRQVVELATAEISRQFGSYLNQIAVILGKILQPIQQVLLSQLQIAQNNTDQITQDLEDAALQQLMQTAFLVQSLQASMPVVAAPSVSATTTVPPVTAAASAVPGGGALFSLPPALQAMPPAPQIAATPEPPVEPPPPEVHDEPLVDEPAPLFEPPTPPPIPPGPFQPIAPPAALVPPPPPLPLPATVAQVLQLLQAAGVQLVQPGQQDQFAAAITAKQGFQFPVDLDQPLAMLFSTIGDPWRARALAWYAPAIPAMLAAGSFAEWVRLVATTSPRTRPALPLSSGG